MAKTKSIPKSVPVIAETPKTKTPKTKTPTLSRTARAASVAARSTSGWELLSATPVLYKFQCVCGGWGSKGYILSPKGDESGQPVDLSDPESVGWVKVGASCLYHFGIAL